MGFTSLMSWKCDFIDAETEGQEAGYRCKVSETETVDISKALFCDDSNYASGSMEGAQELSDLVGIFVAATGMKLNVKKSFWVLMGNERAADGLDITIPIYAPHKARCLAGEHAFEAAQRKPLRRAPKEGEWRHLGNYQSNLGANNLAVKEIEKATSGDLTFIATRQVTKQGFLQGYESKTLQKILYIAKHNNLTARQVCINYKPK